MRDAIDAATKRYPGVSPDVVANIVTHGYLAGWRAGVEAAGNECAKVSRADLMLAAGEMTADEWRASMAAKRYIEFRITKLPPPGCGKGGEGMT